MLGGGMLRLRVLSTLLALAGVAGDHGARGVPWGAAHARPLGFVGAARLGTGPALRRAGATCAYRAAYPPVLHRPAAALPGAVAAVRARPAARLLSLYAVGADGKDEDEWNSYAMLEDSDSEESMDDEVAELPEALSAPAAATAASSAPALEDDPRAVHVPAVEDETSILQGSAFGQVRAQSAALRRPFPFQSVARPADRTPFSRVRFLARALSPPCALALPPPRPCAPAPGRNNQTQMGLPIELCRALASMNIHTPTPIQKASLPVSLAGESVLLCAETGSGKSLAFLLPLVSRLKKDELALGINARPKRPRAVVLAPTRELAAQLLSVAKGLSRHAKFSSVGVLGGSSIAAQAKKLQQPVDLLVATPGRLLDLVKDGHVSLGDVRFVVADEADTMAAQGFGAELEKLLSSVVAASAAAKESYLKSAELSAKELAAATTEEEKAAIEAQLKVVRGPFHPNDRGHVQCVLAAATVKQSVTAIIQSTFPKTREIKTEMAHKVPDGLFQVCY